MVQSFCKFFYALRAFGFVAGVRFQAASAIDPATKRTCKPYLETSVDPFLYRANIFMFQKPVSRAAPKISVAMIANCLQERTVRYEKEIEILQINSAITDCISVAAQSLWVLHVFIIPASISPPGDTRVSVRESPAPAKVVTSNGAWFEFLTAAT